MIETAALILFTVVLFVYYLVTRYNNFWKNHDIPYVEPEFFFGNLKAVAMLKTDIGGQLKNIYETHKNARYVGFYAFHRPALLLRDPELVKDIFVRDSHLFQNRVLSVDENVDPLNGKSIFALKSKRWRQMRNNLTQVFTSGKLKKMVCLVEKVALDLVQYLERAVSSEPQLEVNDVMSRFTIDVMSSCSFGIDSKSLQGKSSEFSSRLHNLLQLSFLQAIANLSTFFAPTLHSLFRVKLTDTSFEKFLRSTVWDTIHFREKNGVQRKDFLDVMMDLRKKGDDFDGDNLVGQAFGFLLAGFDTTATTLTFTMYELALNPEIQSRLRTEILVILEKHNNELTYDAIQEMKYIEMVVNETLRKYSVVPFVDRESRSDYTLRAPCGEGSRTLRAGTGVYIPILAFHHNPEYFPQPQKFDPERFSEENKRQIPRYAYLPFGEGTRNCIGMRFAMIMMKTALTHVMKNFEVAPCKDTPLNLKIEPSTFIVRANGDVPLLFTRIIQV